MDKNAIRKHFLKETSISDEDWEIIQGGLEYRKLKKKEYFLKQGSICRQIGFIIKGYLRLFYLQDGKEITKDFNFENSFCGSWASFSLQLPSNFNVIAMEDTEVIAFTKDQLYKWFEQFPAFERMGRLNMEHMFIKKEIREASFLLDDAEDRYLKLLDQYPGILNRVPIKYIASYLGLTAEMVSRIRRRRMSKIKPRGT